MSRESQHTRFEDQILGQVSLWGRPASCASLAEFTWIWKFWISSLNLQHAVHVCLCFRGSYSVFFLHRCICIDRQFKCSLPLFLQQTVYQCCMLWDHCSCELSLAGKHHLICIICRVFRKSLFFSLTPGQRYVMRIGMGSSQKRYRPINDPVLSIFVFRSIIMGKEPLSELKF